MKLLFIVSQPRSGSTLLQKILSNNSYVATASEPWLLLPFLGMFEKGMHSAKYSYPLMTMALKEFIDTNIGIDKFNQELKDFLIKMYDRLGTSESVYVLDKTPRYYEILPAIKEFFPEAKFIILKRNPLAVISSILTTWNATSVLKLSQYKNDILNSPFKLQDFLDKNKNDSNIIEITYERLVEAPEICVEEIYKWLGIPYSEKVLNYKSNEKMKGTFGDPTGIKKFSSPVNKSSNEWTVLLSQPFWKNFIKGYVRFLGTDFLIRYGNYYDSETIAPKQTEEFKYFLHGCDLQERSVKGYRSEIVNAMRSFYFWLRFGNLVKEWPLKKRPEE